MTLRRLKWLTVIVPLVFLGAIEVLRLTIAPGLFTTVPGLFMLGVIMAVAIYAFAETVFESVARLQSRTERQNRELLALHDAGNGILGELDLGGVLQRVVDRARDLVGAQYGALSLVRDDGTIDAFLTSGITAEERARLGPLPVGHGLLGVVLKEGEPLRLPDITRDPRAVGFPPHHPVMHSLLAVPVIVQGRVLGNLYVAEKREAPEFDIDDERTLQRFATQAALAIDSARLHRRLQALAITEERERIAREMHDSLAQVLGYVNTKAQAAQAQLRNGDTERAAAQIGQLAEAARAAYADVRESILGLRTVLPEQRGLVDALRQYVALWETQSDIKVAFDAPSWPGRRLSPGSEVQLLRIVQEALANVRKHAAATQVRIELTEEDGTLVVLIADNGSGFAAAALPRSAVPRFGLTTMRERAEAIGGTLRIDSTVGEGTRVTVRAPLNDLAGGATDAGAGS